jgi:hypothetical protein
MRVIHPYGCLLNQWLIIKPTGLFQKLDDSLNGFHIRRLFLFRAVLESSDPHIFLETPPSEKVRYVSPPISRG